LKALRTNFIKTKTKIKYNFEIKLHHHVQYKHKLIENKTKRQIKT
ncbi:hypothetical protein DOY81_003795, partial [Sarcophaga bullata]